MFRFLNKKMCIHVLKNELKISSYDSIPVTNVTSPLDFE